MDYSIYKKQIIKKDDTSLVIKLFLPEGSPFFCGHFPDFHLLPAVAQINLVLHYANTAFDCGTIAKSIKRVKFCKTIMHSSEIILAINYNKENRLVSFKIQDAKNVLCATGSIKTKKLDTQNAQGI